MYHQDLMVVYTNKRIVRNELFQAESSVLGAKNVHYACLS